MTTVLHLRGERDVVLCGLVTNRSLGVVDDPEAVTCGRCVQFGAIPNPLVCECPDSDADLSRNFGMCSACKRKPLALMAVRS